MFTIVSYWLRSSLEIDTSLEQLVYVDFQFNLSNIAQFHKRHITILDFLLMSKILSPTIFNSLSVTNLSHNVLRSNLVYKSGFK